MYNPTAVFPDTSVSLATREQPFSAQFVKLNSRKSTQLTLPHHPEFLSALKIHHVGILAAATVHVWNEWPLEFFPCEDLGFQCHLAFCPLVRTTWGGALVST